MPEGPSTILKIPGGKIQEYVMKEVKLKLEGGHSVADIEGHLNNTVRPVLWEGTKFQRGLVYWKWWNT